MPDFRLILVFPAPLGAVLMSCRRSSPLEPGQTLEVIDEVGHADLDGGAGDADSAHDEPHPVLLPREHMLDLGADLGSSGIGPGDPIGQRLPRLALLVDVALEHACRQKSLVFLRPVGRVCPDARTGIGLADQVRQSCTVMGIGGAGIPGADQPMGLVDADVVLVTVRLSCVTLP